MLRASLILIAGSTLLSAHQGESQPVHFLRALRAVEEGDLDTLKHFLEIKPDLQLKDDEGRTLLMSAAGEESESQTAIVEAILHSEGDKSINAIDAEGATALHHAAKARTLQSARVIELLLKNGADPNIAAKGNFTVLMAVCSQNPQARSVQLLIEAGAKIDAVDDLGNTPLHWACGFNQVPRDSMSTIMLLSEGGDLDARNKAGWTPLMALALSPGSDLVGYLTDRNVPDDDRETTERVNDTLPDGWTPLMLAVASYEPTIWKRWFEQIDLGDTLEEESPEEKQALSMYAGMYCTWSRSGYVGRVWNLLKAVADPEAKGDDGTTVDSLLQNRRDADADAVRALIQSVRNRRAAEQGKVDE